MIEIRLLPKGAYFSFENGSGIVYQVGSTYYGEVTYYPLHSPKWYSVSPTTLVIPVFL